MIVKQLSVFLENKPSRLSAAIDALAKAGIDISALSLADTADFGILRLIVSDPEKAEEVLESTGVVGRITDVLALAMEDVPGGMAEILRVLSDEGLNIEYIYACVGRMSGKALTVMRVSDPEKAEKALRANGYGQVRPEDVYRL